MSAHKGTFGEWLSELTEMLIWTALLCAGIIGYVMNIYKLFTENEQGVIMIARIAGMVVVFFGAILGWF